MKILAIRGSNLASLCGTFDVDFERDPLKNAGLFAISGPTGAGKSTLLDALCLALYDATPRLSQAGTQGVRLRDVGDESLSPQDPRNLLRKGAVEGQAEVDFVGNDGQAYRSRWSVRRARLRVDGRLQNSEMGLIRLSDRQPVGHLKSEVLEGIKERIGLSFSQFTRAVLLAQNEFSAFLKAQTDERAQLLETLTGTTVFTAISVRAFERNKAESQKLESLQMQLDAQRPLTDEARLELLQQLQTVREVQTRSEARKAELEDHIRWHQDWEALKNSEAEAVQVVDLKQQERLAAAERQQYLNTIERIQEARPRIVELDRTLSDLRQTETDLARQADHHAKADNAVIEASQQLQTARAALLSAENAKTQAQPDLLRARDLESQIRAIEPNHAQASETHTRVIREQKQANEELIAKQAEQRAASTELERTQVWLKDHAHLETLALQWPRWDTLFGQAGETLNEVSGLERAQELGRTALTQLTENLAARKQKLDQSMQTFQTAEAALAQAEKALTGQDGEVLAAQQRQAHERRDRLRTAEALWSRQSKLQADRAGQQTKHQHLATRINEMHTQLEMIRAAKPGLETRLEQAERAFNAAQVACGENVEQLRVHLEAGEPCPVCGAIDHPYVEDNPPLRSVLKTLEAQVQGCRTELNQSESREAVLAAALEQHHQQLAECVAALNQFETELARLINQSQSHVLADEAEAVEKSQREAWFEAQLNDIEARIQEVDRALKAFAAAGKQLEKSRKTFDSANRQREDHQKACQMATTQLAEAQSRLETESQKLIVAQGRLEQFLGSLDEAFASGSWRDAWRDAPESYRDQAEQDASRWLAKRDAISDLNGRLTQLAAERQGIEQKLAKATGYAQEAKAQFELMDRTLTEKRRQRAALFQGQPVADAEAALDQAITSAKSRVAAADTQSQEAEKAKASSAATLAQAQSRQKNCGLAAETARSNLAAWISGYHDTVEESGRVDETLLRQWLIHDQNWITAERQALKELETALLTVQTVLRERHENRARHETQRPTDKTRQELDEILAVLLPEFKGLQDRFSELSLALKQDEDRRKASGELLQQYERQQAVQRTWAKLNELIGSADGKRFRNVAQQYTLDVLLGYANRHLRDLTHRYRLERVTDTLALQVVDQDMGDEIRSVHSLSGGESFLVSLALALGLASLSSNRVKVESLFIDEGFGSLDADTLRIAMDALDNLQSKGRKVGVISHVQEMTERIGTRIQVKRASGGQSKIQVCG